MISLDEYRKSVKGKKIAFCGVGVSNMPLVSMYTDFGAEVTVCDKKSADELGDKIDKLEKTGCKMQFGENWLAGLEKTDILFRTPGMNYNLPELAALRGQGVQITSEIEEFFKLCPSKIIAVTGSDGKTTTTSIIAELLKAQGKRVFLGGNIGAPLLPRVMDITKDDIAVAELSSFQLISMNMSPSTAVITNIAPNHLDVHKDMDEYINAKKNIFTHQKPNDRLVLNFENDITRSFVNEAAGEVITFGHDISSDNCVFVDNGVVSSYKNGVKSPLFEVRDIRIPGDHNVQNYMAAAAATLGLVSCENMDKTAREFAGVEHRIEFVREINGVRWYNDSIATSPTRAIAGINSFSQKLIIIAGGYDKHIPFKPFAERAVTGAKALILMGKTADAIEKAVREAPGYAPGNPAIIRAKSMEDAVLKAKNIAEKGDIVTLSPASASFDMYPNFAVRGNHFKDIVNRL